MGRPQRSQPPLPIEYVRDALQVSQDGQLDLEGATPRSLPLPTR